METLHYLIFHSQRIDGCELCGQTFKNNQIFQISDYTKMLNCFFVRDPLANLSVYPFQNYFNKSENLYQHNTRYVEQNFVIVTQQSADFYDITLIQH